MMGRGQIDFAPQLQGLQNRDLDCQTRGGAQRRLYDQLALGGDPADIDLLAQAAGAIGADLTGQFHKGGILLQIDPGHAGGSRAAPGTGPCLPRRPEMLASERRRARQQHRCHRPGAGDRSETRQEAKPEYDIPHGPVLFLPPVIWAMP